MKYLLFICTIFLSNLSADSIYSSMCILDFYTKDNLIYLTTANDSIIYTVDYSTDLMNSLIQSMNKFKFIDGKCVPVDNNYSPFLSSLVGILFGFTIMFFSILVTIKVASK